MVKKSSLLSIALLIAVCIAMFFAYTYVTVETVMWLHWLGIVIFVVAVYSWSSLNQEKLFCPYNIFLLFMFLFNFGQCAMWAIGLQEDLDLTTKFPPESLLKAELYTCLSVLAFHIGALSLSRIHFFVRKRKALGSSIADMETAERQRSNLYFVCKCLSVIAIPIAIYSAIRDYTIANAYGYNALYYGEYATQSGYSQILMYLFVPCLFGLLIGSNFNKRISWFVYIVFGLYTLCYALSGERGNWLYSLIVMLYLSTRNKKLSLKKVLPVVIVGYLTLSMLSIITENRSNLQGLTLGTFFKEAFSTENSPVVGAFFEMGGSMGIITNLLYVGKEIFTYSNTYITAVLGMVSTRFVSLAGLDFVLLGDWYSQDYLGISWGAGFSMVGEAFINGGYFGGLLYMAALGMIIGKVLKVRTHNHASNPINLFVSVSVLNAICRFPRAASYLLLKQIFYSVGVVIIAMMLVDSIKRRYIK